MTPLKFIKKIKKWYINLLCWGQDKKGSYQNIGVEAGTASIQLIKPWKIYPMPLKLGYYKKYPIRGENIQN